MNAALAEASTYHNLDANGFFAVRAYGGQSLHRLADMPRVLDRLPVPPDLQISQAEYRSPRNRTKVNVLRIGLSFVDCDLYVSQYAHLKPDQVVRALLLFCDDQGIPRPNLINFSGRGIHVKWLLDTPLPAAALVRWGLVQKALASRLAEFGVDKFALDASRCLRAVGTLNVRSGETAVTVWEDGSRWDFNVLAEALLPYTREQVAAFRQELAAKKAVRAAARATNTPTKKARPCNLWTIPDLWCHRLEDVRTLIGLRGWTNGVPEGHRGKVLLVATTCCHWAHRPANLEAEAQELARQMCPSFTHSDVRSVVCSLVVKAKANPTDKSLRLRTQTILDWLAITSAEQRHLRTLYDRADRPQRDRERHRKFSDRETYLANAQQRREQAQALRAQGLPLAAIAAEMGRSVDSMKTLLRKR